MTIIEFLEARIAEDMEEAAWYGNTEYFEGGWTKAHTGRVLRECAAKRAIIGSQQSCVAAEAKEGDLGPKLVARGMHVGLELSMKFLAAVYSDHPDYQQEWAP